jgi:hypothetical protein
MTTIKIVRYATAPEHADDNAQLVRDVFAELAATRPEGLHYATFRLDDQVSFVHIAVLDGEDNPLGTSTAFAAFQAGIAQRCTTAPVAADAELIASYQLFDDLPAHPARHPG